MSEHSATFTICNRLGLHARAAAVLAQTVGPFEAVVTLEKDGQHARANSVIELLLLCAHEGTNVTVTAHGSDAEAAIAAVGELIGNRFGESS